MVSKKMRRLSFFLVPLAMLTGLFILFTRNLSPILISMAEARARQLAVEAMNRAIAEVMDSSVTYTDLMRVSHDSSGRVSMLEANATLMNEIASAAALTAQSKLDTLADVVRVSGHQPDAARDLARSERGDAHRHSGRRRFGVGEHLRPHCRIDHRRQRAGQLCQRTRR